MQHPS